MSNATYIHPNATGRAAKTVEQHQDAQDLVFYAGWASTVVTNGMLLDLTAGRPVQFCPYVQRSWIALEERGIPYQYKEVNPYKKEKHFLDINPKGLVPAIEYKGKAMYESLILCEFFEDAFPEHTPHLLPTDPFDRAYVRLWTDHVAKQIVPVFMRLVMAQEPEKQQEYLQDYYNALRTLTEKVRGPYFLGEHFSLVDIALAPWVLRDYILAENRGYSRDAAGSAWKAYAEALETRDSVCRTQSDREHYAEIYARYLRNEAQSEAAKAIRAGKPF